MALLTIDKKTFKKRVWEIINAAIIDLIKHQGVYLKVTKGEHFNHSMIPTLEICEWKLKTVYQYYKLLGRQEAEEKAGTLMGYGWDEINFEPTILFLEEEARIYAATEEMNEMERDKGGDNNLFA